MVPPQKLPLAQRVLTSLQAVRARVVFTPQNTSTTSSSEFPVQVFPRDNPNTYVSKGVFTHDVVVPYEVASRDDIRYATWLRNNAAVSRPSLAVTSANAELNKDVYGI